MPITSPNIGTPPTPSNLIPAFKVGRGETKILFETARYFAGIANSGTFVLAGDRNYIDKFVNDAYLGIVGNYNVFKGNNTFNAEQIEVNGNSNHWSEGFNASLANFSGNSNRVTADNKDTGILNFNGTSNVFDGNNAGFVNMNGDKSTVNSRTNSGVIKIKGNDSVINAGFRTVTGPLGVPIPFIPKALDNSGGIDITGNKAQAFIKNSGEINIKGNNNTLVLEAAERTATSQTQVTVEGFRNNVSGSTGKNSDIVIVKDNAATIDLNTDEGNDRITIESNPNTDFTGFTSGTINTGSGNDIVDVDPYAIRELNIDGGSGTRDRVSFQGPQTDYTLRFENGSGSATHNETGAVVNFTNVEELRFNYTDANGVEHSDPINIATGNTDLAVEEDSTANQMMTEEPSAISPENTGVKGEHAGVGG